MGLGKGSNLYIIIKLTIIPNCIVTVTFIQGHNQFKSMGDLFPNC